MTAKNTRRSFGGRPSPHLFPEWVTSHALWVLLTVVGVIYAVALFNHGLVPSMEPRFAEAVREMVQRGQYLIPIKNGVPYIEYPPLYFWLAGMGHLSGLPIAAAIRLPSYVAFLLWIVWLARVQRRLYPEWPSIALPLAGAALPGVLYTFFVAQTDGVLILGVLIALSGYVRPKPGFNWELWLGIALATLAKGPVGMAVTLPVIGIDLVLVACLPKASTRAPWRVFCRQLRAITPWRGIGLVLLVNTPWYLAAGLVVNWEFVRATIIYQNVIRFLIGFDHLKPWWYYAKTIFYDVFPLVFLLPFGIYLAIRRLSYIEWRVPLIWALWTLVFFSCSQSKQGKYILTAAPAFAMLALATIACINFSTARIAIGRIVSVVEGGLIVVFGVIVIGYLPSASPRLLHTPAYDKLHAVVRARPGEVTSYRWPKSRLLYEFGAPMAHFRSAQSLYKAIHSGKLAAGGYVLVSDVYLPGGKHADDATALVPLPRPPYMEKVATVAARSGITLYRVLPGAASQSVPVTPAPPVRHWWDQFDTD